MAVTAQTPITQYDGSKVNGTTKDYAFNFHLISTTDISVLFNGTEQAKNTYIVTIQNNQGGTITFNTAPPAGTEIMIRRATPFERLNDYQDNGDLRAKTIDEDFDRLWLALQEQKASTDIVISRPVGGTAWDARSLPITHVGPAVNPTDAITKGQVDADVNNASTSALAAGTSEANAKTSETNAKTSETNAKASENAAAASAQNLATAVTNAGNSAAAALASQQAAKTSETNAKTSETNAKASETSVAGVAAAALASQNAAAGSATAAKASENAAAASATQAARDAAAIAGNIGTAATNAATTTQNVKDAQAAAGQAAASAGTASNAATTATSAQQDAQSAKRDAEAARDAALNVAPGNYMLKTNNLSDLADKAAARTNLALDRISQADSSQTYVFSGDKTKKLLIDNAGNWGAWNNTIDGAIPLAVSAGGTGATNASGARINLEVERYNQSASETYIQTPDRLKYFTINDAGDWGMWDTATQSHIPLSIQDGGTGAGNAKQARYNLNAATGSEAVRIPNGENVLAYVASQAQSGYYSCGDNATQLPSGNEGYWMFNFHCHGVNTQGIAEYGHLTAIGASSGRMWHCRLIALANWTGWQLITSADDPLAARSVLKVTFQDDQPIADSESVNDDRFFAPGFYYKQYDPAATIDKGFPPGNRSGALHTVLNGANGAKGVTQLYYPYMGAGGAYFRQYDAMRNKFIDGNIYGGWKEFLSSNGQVVAGANQPVTADNLITDMNAAKMNHVGFSYNSANNSPGKSGTFVGFESAIVRGYGFQLIGSYDAPGNLYYRSRNGDSQTWYPWVKMYGTNNTTTDTNGNLKPSSPIVKLKGDGTAELNGEAEGVTVERIDTGVYKVSGVLGFHSDPIWGGMEGGYVIPQNGNGLPLLWVDYDVEANGDITLRTYHREHVNVPAFARNHIEGLTDGDPVDIPAGRWVDLRVEMPEAAK